MVSPDHFQFNVETSATNSFQHEITDQDLASKVSTNALSEFETLGNALASAGVNVCTMKSRADVCTPDSVFPNNWFSVHTENDTTTLVLYPMLNINRQAERQTDVLTDVLSAQGIHIDNTIDLTYFEKEGKALEGTGSLVLDRVNRIAYASISPRMDAEVLKVFCDKLNYTAVMFSSYNIDHKLIYHTNVMMSVGQHFAVLCKASITDRDELNSVVTSLESTGKLVIDITQDQLNNMCGNILELRSRTDGRAKIAMSNTAYHAFTTEQKEVLQRYGDIVHVDISTIETVGGGSVRCMLAEIFSKE